MDTFDDEWFAQFQKDVTEHVLYSPAEQQRLCLLPEYQQVLNTLDCAQRQIIQQYHYLCQKREAGLSAASYLAGIQVGERRASKKENRGPFV